MKLQESINNIKNNHSFPDEIQTDVQLIISFVENYISHKDTIIKILNRFKTYVDDKDVSGYSLAEGIIKKFM